MEGESCRLSAPRGGMKTGRSESIARVVGEVQAAMDMFEEFQMGSKLS